MNQQKVAPIAVYGASGHTGKFVVADLLRRGFPVVAVARDPSRLPADVPGRVAALHDPDGLDRAFAGCGLVINCAGPFLDTAAPIIEAALRTGCSYVDVTAEQESARSTFEAFDRPARDAGVTVIPAAGFYGGLADLLASALIGGGNADAITIVVALDRWWPTEGTRKTGERNTFPRVIVENGKLAPLGVSPQRMDWSFDAPFGVQPVEAATFSEIITISRHLDVRSVRSYLNAAALGDIRNASTPPPTAIDALGRSAQRFAMDVVAVGADGTRRATAHGQDIYAVTAPIVAEAAARILDPSFQGRGALALGQAFDAKDFLQAVSPHVGVKFDPA